MSSYPNTLDASRAALIAVAPPPSDSAAIVDHLKGFGFRVQVVYDGRQVLACAKVLQPDLIVLDLEMQGIETCRLLKHDEQTRDAVVILMASPCCGSDMVEGLGAGAVDFVTKPVRLDELVARVRTHLELRAKHGRNIVQNHLRSDESRSTGFPEALGELARYDADARTPASEVRFRTIVESSPVPLCITVMPSGHVLYANSPLRELLLMGEHTSATVNIVDFYVDEKDRERLINRLATEGSFREAEVEVRRTDGTRFWAMVTARVAPYGGVPAVFFGLHDLTERKRVEEELVRAREQQREFSAYLAGIHEDERKRSAFEIQDELGQLLAALKMDVSLLRMRLSDDREAVQKADHMRELLDDSLCTVRYVASHLRPTALNYGIVSALEWLTKDFSQRSGIPCELLVDGGEPALTDTHATTLFRIVQAALTNVARHARARRVDVAIATSEKSLDVQVCDDGRGFDQVTARGRASYGLLGMKERAISIGGDLRIDSRLGEGTKVSIHIPLVSGFSS